MLQWHVDSWGVGTFERVKSNDDDDDDDDDDFSKDCTSTQAQWHPQVLL